MMVTTEFEFSATELVLAQAALKANPRIDANLLSGVIKRDKVAAEALRRQLLGLDTQRPEAETEHADGAVVSLDRLSQHPFNTRILGPDAPDLIALAASIERSGQIEPLTVMAATDGSADTLVIDGARRLGALRRLGRKSAKVMFVQMNAAEVAAAIHARDRQQKRWSAYEYSLYLAAIVSSFPTEAACAAAVGMTTDAFCKARAPARMPACVIAKVADPRMISGKDAATICAHWNRDASAVESAMAGVSGPVPAKQVLAVIVGAAPIKSSENAMIVIPRDQLLAVLAELENGGAVIPAALADLLQRTINPSR